MERPVMILNTDKVIKAVNLCDRLVWEDITYTFEKVVDCYTVTVAEKDVPKALGRDF